MALATSRKAGWKVAEPWRSAASELCEAAAALRSDLLRGKNIESRAF